MPTRPAITKVAAPRAKESLPPSGTIRESRYTPAVTKVAAWIRAEIGVGASIAEGNQACRPNWADLAAAPASSRKQSQSRLCKVGLVKETGLARPP